MRGVSSSTTNSRGARPAGRTRYVINDAGRAALASSSPRLTDEERELLASIAAGAPSAGSGSAGSGPGARMSSAEAVRALARLQTAGLISARDWHPSRTEPDESQIGSEAAKAAGQLRRTGFHISLASQLTGVLNARRGGHADAAPSPRLLLLASDNAEVANLIRLMLAPEGYRLRAVPLHDAARSDLPDNHTPDLILIDGTPLSDAIAATRAVRLSGDLGGCRIVMLCDGSSDDGVLGALAAGADALVAKPFDMEVIVRVIDSLLAN